jgi:hypothetical protein
MSRSYVRRAVPTAIVLALLIGAPAALAGGPGQWTVVTPDASGGPDLARTGDGRLHVVWTAGHPTDEPNMNPRDLFHRSISPAGEAGPIVKAVDNWEAMSPPGLAAGPGNGDLAAFFGGAATIGTGTNSPITRVGSVDGGSSWSAPTGASSEGTESAVTATRLGSVYWQAWGGSLHRGVDPSVPPFDVQRGLTPELGMDADSQINIDGDAGANRVMTAWSVDTTKNARGGVYTRAFKPSGASAGGRMHMPGTHGPAAHFGGSIPLVSIPGRGSYVAYATGASHREESGDARIDTISVWPVGAKRSVVVARPRFGTANSVSGNFAEGFSLATTPDRRLWVTWARLSHGVPIIKARRSSPNVRQWGATVTVRTPKHTELLDSLDSDGNPSGAVDLVASMGSASDGLTSWHTQVLPGLTVKTAGSIPRGMRRIRVMVLDAGAPVAGASVVISGGATGTTGKNGVARVGVGHLSRSVKSVALTVTRPGYSVGHRRIAVR